MEAIKQKFNQLLAPNYVSSQTLFKFNKDGGKTQNVLFVSPTLNSYDLYKMILPAMMLEHLENWKIALTSIELPNTKVDFEDINIAITPKQILWADVIVFPFTKQDLLLVYNQIGAINPNCKIMYCVDFNFYEISQYHSQYKLFNNSSVKLHLVSNMRNANKVLVSNYNLAHYLKEKLNTDLHQFNISVVPQLFVSAYMTESLKAPEKTKSDAFRIGIICSENDYEDLNANKKMFEDINKKYGDKVKLIFIGFDGRLPHKNKYALDKIKHTHIAHTPMVDFTPKNNHFLQKLLDLNIDLGWVVQKESKFNESSANYNKYLDFAMCNIPIMSSKAYPYNRIIKNGISGFVYEKKADIVAIIDSLIKDVKLKEDVVINSIDMINNNFSYNQKKYEQMAKIYS
jgi:hypothetical protein